MWKKYLMTVLSGLSLSYGAAIAAPTHLIIHNTTDVESNAYIAGSIPSVHPSKSHSDNKVFWGLVKLSCQKHIVNNTCQALIKMETNTTHPVDLGMVTLNLASGEITPASITNNGYSLTINGPAEVTLTTAG
ncbi:MAG: hypothetical protein Q8R79_00355 [Legionellaceae bacterium]|nr:hypothetical protein [Legionellaceae bacterium]